MNILLALDGSSYSCMLTHFTRALCADAKGEATVLTVIPEHVFLGKHTFTSIIRRSTAQTAETQRAEEEKATELLRQSAEGLVGTGLKVTTRVDRGNPAEAILKACHDTDADVAVIGVKGLSGAPGFLLGGVAQKIVKYAPCSVLVVKEEAQDINRVLVPLDGSRHADETVRFLLRLPLPQHTEVTLVAVAESFAEWLAEAPTMDMEANLQIISELQKSEEESAKRLTEDARTQFRKAGYMVSTTVARGDPSQQILQTAAQRNVDFIALGSQGLTGIRSFLLGSVAQRIVRYAGCSVLIVRAPKAKAE
jgi:nucleotide-binding universal stress UspA family protein